MKTCISLTLLAMGIIVTMTLVGCNVPPRLSPTPSPTVTLTPRADQRTATAEQRAAERGAEATHAAETRSARVTQATLTAGAPTPPVEPPMPTPPSMAVPSPGGSPLFPVATILPQTPFTETATPGGRILSFQASPTLIDPGGSFTLSWEVASGDPYLCSVQWNGALGECNPIPLTGSQVIAVSAEARNFVQWFLFMADNPAGIGGESASVTVYLTCPDTWFFASPPADCPYPAIYSAGAAQRFERGLMIWVEATAEIFILFSDGSTTPGWTVANNTWFEGMPEDDPSIEAPPGLYEPVRGFGQAWRGEGLTFAPRDRLGWAMGPEFPMDTIIQCDTPPKYVTCYLQGPDGVLVLEPEFSAWHLYAP